MSTTISKALDRVEGAAGEMALDLSPVARVAAGDLQALAQLADKAEQRQVRVVLTGVNVDVYRVLKLVRLAPRFTFAN